MIHTQCGIKTKIFQKSKKKGFSTLRSLLTPRWVPVRVVLCRIVLKVAVNVSRGEQTFPQIMADFSLFVH